METDNQIGERILWKVSGEEKVNRMQKALLTVSTSMVEGWRVTVIEATACKTPAVAYNVLEVKDFVNHMETGTLIESGDIKRANTGDNVPTNR